MRALLLAALLAGPGPAPAKGEAARATDCHAEQAVRCEPQGCTPVEEGLDAERFLVDLRARTVTACLYTDCLSGRATVVRDPARPWVATAFALVRSERRPGSTPPPGSGPLAVTVTVDLRTGRFAASWGLSPEGQQTDFGGCTLER